MKNVEFSKIFRVNIAGFWILLLLTGCPEDNQMVGSPKKKSVSQLRTSLTEARPDAGTIISDIVATDTESIKKMSESLEAGETVEAIQDRAGEIVTKSGFKVDISDPEEIAEYIEKVIKPVISAEDIVIEADSNHITFLGLREDVKDYEALVEELSASHIRAILTKGLLQSDPCQNDQAVLMDLAAVLDLSLKPDQTYSLSVCTLKNGKVGAGGDIRVALLSKVFTTWASQPGIASVAKSGSVVGSAPDEVQKVRIELATVNPESTRYLLIVRNPEEGTGVWDPLAKQADPDEMPEDAPDEYWISASENPGSQLFRSEASLAFEIFLPAGADYYFSVMARNNRNVATGLSGEVFLSLKTGDTAGEEEGSSDPADEAVAEEKNDDDEKPVVENPKSIDQQLAEAKSAWKESRKKLKIARLARAEERKAFRTLKKSFKKEKKDLKRSYKKGTISKEEFHKKLKVIRADFDGKAALSEKARDQATDALKAARKMLRKSRKEFAKLKKERRKVYKSIYKKIKEKRKQAKNKNHKI